MASLSLYESPTYLLKYIELALLMSSRARNGKDETSTASQLDRLKAGRGHSHVGAPTSSSSLPDRQRSRARRSASSSTRGSDATGDGQIASNVAEYARGQGEYQHTTQRLDEQRSADRTREGAAQQRHDIADGKHTVTARTPHTDFLQGTGRVTPADQSATLWVIPRLTRSRFEQTWIDQVEFHRAAEPVP